MSAYTQPAAGVASKSGYRLPIGVCLSMLWLIALVAVAIVGPKISPYPTTQIDLTARLTPPFGFGGTTRHLLGTDELGRDVLSRLIESIRLSVFIAFGATIIATSLGTFLGLVAAHFRGVVEHIILAAIDFQASMPFLILALAVLAFFENSLFLFVLIMGLHGWERHARIARGLVSAANRQSYAGAIRQLGAHPVRVYVHHILPNIAATLIVSATMSFPEAVLMESGLSFLGLGVQPPMSSLGNMVGYGRDYITRASWILLCPCTVIITTTVAVSLLGDWLRDRLDPTIGD